MNPWDTVPFLRLLRAAHEESMMQGRLVLAIHLDDDQVREARPYFVRKPRGLKAPGKPVGWLESLPVYRASEPPPRTPPRATVQGITFGYLQMRHLCFWARLGDR